MAYCTFDDLTDRFGEAEIAQLTDRLGVGAADKQIATRAISDAEAEIDGYLRGRVALPLVTVPAVLTRVACDLARYRLFGTHAPEEVRTRYEDARSWLRDVAGGRVVLVESTVPAGAGPAVVAPPVIYDAATMTRMPG